jgi:hypothetical protein
MSQQECRGKAQKVHEFFEEEAEGQARASGFVQRVSKVTGKIFAVGVVLACIGNPAASLREMVRVAGKLGVTVSEAGWQQRIGAEAVRFLAGMVAAGLRQFGAGSQLPAEVLSGFSRVELLDSTEIALTTKLRAEFAGAKRQAALKLQVSFNYLAGVFSAIQVTPARLPDQKCQLHLELAQPNSLHLFDLGYFNQEVFKALMGMGAFFISRFQTQTAVYEQPEAGQALDLPAFLAGLPHARWEGWLYLGRKARVPVRLLVERLPQATTEERRRKARQSAKRRGQTCSARHLTLLGWSLFITNVPADRLSFDHVLRLYRLRWQVELLFKLCKSQAKLATCLSYSQNRFLCQFYARLLSLLIFHWLTASLRVTSHGELSLPKAFAIFQSYASDFSTTFSCLAPFTTLFCQLQEDFLRYALKSKRRKSPSTYLSLCLLPS